jgi:hypothetical protein
MSNKEIIITALNRSVNDFNELIMSLDKHQFESNPNQKWSAGQDLVHLIKLLRILNIAYTIPKPILSVLYGSNNKISRSFENLRALYKSALAGGAKSPALYLPKPVMYYAKENLILKHETLNQKFINKLNQINESDLDTYQLPHPILGKVTLRELAIFTSFHTEHHFELLKSKLSII